MLPILNYDHVSRLKASDAQTPNSHGAMAAIPAAIAVIPFVGYMLQSGPLFLGGGLLTFVSTVLALVGFIRSAVVGIRAEIACWLASFLFNVAVASYFVWLFFVQGLC